MALPETSYLLSVPPSMVEPFSEVEGRRAPEWFAGCDPPGGKVGSGGATLNLLALAWRAGGASSFADWLQAGHKTVIHGGGQSRRLPAYGAVGKPLAPMPVWRWEVGQRLDQNLLDLQLPFLRTVHSRASSRVAVTVASGDVLIRATPELPPLPDADVLCLGLWVRPEEAQHFGVMFFPRRRPDQLAFFLQKPDLARLKELSRDYLFLVDTGIWLLSARAIAVLAKKCGCDPRAPDPARLQPYELYAQLGPTLGSDPTVADPDARTLTHAGLALPQGEFYHFGTSRDLCRSYARLQNLVLDQRQLYAPFTKPHPDLFVQNARLGRPLSADNHQVWIENAHVPTGWKLTREHVITGAPPNDWSLSLEPGTCLDFVPVEATATCLRGYDIDDTFRGAVGGAQARWFGRPVSEWLAGRNLSLAEARLHPETDLQEAALFPVLSPEQLTDGFIRWMTAASPGADGYHASLWLQSPRLSAQALGSRANPRRLYAQRKALRLENIPLLFYNRRKSVFFALDLARLAGDLAESGHALEPLDAATPGSPSRSACLGWATDPLARAKDHMLRAMTMRHRGQAGWEAQEEQAFGQLREAIVESAEADKVEPRLHLVEDQIVWGRSPVRLDLAGGWSDTPPYCLEAGGCVLNVAVELNGQLPIQVFARQRSSPDIVVRSIDLGIDETITSYEQIGDHARVGDPFSIVKAALALAGFHPRFRKGAAFPSLRVQLQVFGGGLELSLLAAVPKGSGLGTSSILAATALGTLSEVCALGWTQEDLIRRTLVLEQMLTTGGGWQDQAGGILPGLKLIETVPSLDQSPSTRWLPDTLLSAPHANETILLYYSGITRVAKDILQEIVRGIFLNSRDHLEVVRQIARHARHTAEVVQRRDLAGLAAAVAHSWDLNQRLDAGTNPPSVAAILASVQDWLLSAKLLGAGGGGYILMFAKDVEAARRLRQQLQDHPPNSRARFVSFSVSPSGLQITRS
jgi:galactokinase/mevalonate kinase-like predicted kinase